MLTFKEKQEIKKLKAEKRRKLSRKRTLILRNKAIRLYQLRWFKRASSALPPALAEQPVASKQYAGAFKELRNNREFNYYLYRKDRFSKRQRLLATTKLKRYSTRHPFRKLRRAFDAPRKSANLTTRAARLLLSRYYRCAYNPLKLSETMLPSRFKREATFRRGRWSVSRLGRTRVTLVSRGLLVRRAATGLRIGFLPAPTASAVSDKSGPLLFDSQAAYTEVKEHARQPIRSSCSAATPLVGVKARRKSPAPMRTHQKQSRTYAADRGRLLRFVNRLSAYRRMPSKYSRQRRRMERVKRLAGNYSHLKEALRERFFARQPLAAQLASSQVLELPALVTAQTFVAQRLVRTRAQRVYQRRCTSLSRHTVFPQAARSRAVTLKRGTRVGNLLKRAQPAAIPQPTANLRSCSIKSRLSVVRTSYLSSLTAYRATKKANTAVLIPRTPTRRQRRSVARSARLRRNISKGQKKRLRLGRIQQKARPTGYPTLPAVTKLGASVTWKRQRPASYRRRAYKQLGAITSAFTLSTRLYRKQRPTVSTSQNERMLFSRRVKRNALWALFSAAQSYRDLLAVGTAGDVTVTLLVQRLRRVIRRGSSIPANEVTAMFTFLLHAYLRVAPQARKLLHAQFNNWLQALQHATFKSSIKLMSKPLGLALRAVSKQQSRGAAHFNTGLSRKLLHLLLKSGEEGTDTPTVVTKQLATKLRSADSKRLKLRTALLYKMPRTVLPSFPKEDVAISVGQLPSFAHGTPYSRALPKASTGVTHQTTPPLTSAFTPQHRATTILKYTHPKKHLTRRLEFRKTRFVRFVPRYVRRPIVRKIIRACNRAASAGPVVPILRYFRYAYCKGNRIFIVRRAKDCRITTRRLIKQQRWSRATALRLRRRRPVWRRIPEARQIKTSTLRVITRVPFNGTGRGWRLRKARVARKGSLRAQTERFKSLLQQSAAPLPTGAGGTHTGVAPRLLRLVTATNKQAQLLPGVPEGSVEAPRVATFYIVQRQLAAQRSRRAAAATSRFNHEIGRTAKDNYKRCKGRFLLINDRRRKHPRRPRWVRVVSKTSETLNFAPQRQAFTPINSTTSNTLQLPTQLLVGINPYQSDTSKTKVSAGVNPRLPAPTIVANGSVQTALVRKMRRLVLIKKLLRGNKFSKLARLGELNALGEEYSALASLGTLFELGGFTEELKKQLLVQLAAGIKFCAMLCAQGAPEVTPVDAITTGTSARVLFTYNKPSVIFGRDPNFFISDVAPVKTSALQILQKTALLNALSTAKTKNSAAAPVASKWSNLVLARSAEDSTLSRAKRLQYYRRALVVQNPDRDEKLALLWGRAGQYSQSARKNIARPRSLQLRPASCSRLAARFTTSDKLPIGYSGTTCTVISPKLWTSCLGHWVSKNRIQPSKARTAAKSFSSPRPWGVKTLHLGGLAKEYGRITNSLAGVVSLKLPKQLARRRGWVGLAKRFTYLRLAAARTVRAYSRPTVLHCNSNTIDRNFWQLQTRDNEQVQARAEQHTRSRMRVSIRATGSVLKVRRPLFSRRPVRVIQPSLQVKKIKPLPAAQKHSFESLHIKTLNVTVFDSTVRSNLQKFGAMSHTTRVTQQGYELLKRAYKAALSSQQRNPKLPDLRFEEQKAVVRAILTPVAGVAPVNDVVLEWKQLPKNKVVAPQRLVVVPAPKQPSLKTPLAFTSELTQEELKCIYDEATKKDLTNFTALPPQNRQNNNAYLLVKKAVLRSWTSVEGSAVPAESPFYKDLLLSAKAYSFYNVTLDLTSKSATVAKVASNFAKLPK